MPHPHRRPSAHKRKSFAQLPHRSSRQPRKPSQRRSWFVRLFTKRTSPLAWYRIIPLLFVLVLGFTSALVYKGPDDLQRSYYQIDYIEDIQESSDRHRVSPYLVCAVIKAESDWDPQSSSRKGAQGLMQLLPKTAEFIADQGLVDKDAYPLDDLADPRVSIEYGSAYLRYLVDRYHEIEPVIAAYNAGPGNVDKWRKKRPEEGKNIRKVIEFPETEKYLYKVVRAKAAYEVLYPETFR